jgi:hypothetical protein
MIRIGSNRSQSSPKPVARISPVSSIKSQLNNRPSPLENVRIGFLCATRTRIVHLVSDIYQKNNNKKQTTILLILKRIKCFDFKQSITFYRINVCCCRY